MPKLSALHRRQLVRWWGWFLLTTILFELLIALRYLQIADLDDSPAAVAFRAVMLLAHFTTLACLLLCPVLLVILVQPRAWIAIPLGIACSTAILIALLIDTQVYQLYRFHINAGVLNLLLGGAAHETFVFSDAMYLQAALLATAIALVVALAATLWWGFVRQFSGRRSMAGSIAITLLIAVVGFHSVHIWADAHAYEPLVEQTHLLPLRYAATAKRSLRALGVRVPTRPVFKMTARQDRNDLAYPLRPLECRAPARRPNIIVIVIDSWRFDAMNAAVTPNIDAFAHNSVQFLDHHSGGNATRIGVFSLFYAIPGTYWHRMLAERQAPVFIEELLRAGYGVHAFRSAPLFSPEFDRTVFARLHALRMRSDGEHPADRDQDLTEDFLSFLTSRSDAEPFFALLFYDSPHKFDLPRDYPLVFQPTADSVNYFGLDNSTDPRPMLNRYRNSIHYVDSLVGRALAALEEHGLLDDSVVVMTGDHGQEFNDNGRNYWGHGSNFTRYQTGVPLVIRAPDLAPAAYRHRTTHFDVIPTLMRDYLGCDEPFSTYSVGQPLYEHGGRDVVVLSEYADFAIVQHDRIAVVREQGMEVRDANYAELPGARLAPDAIAAALEQKSRFYRRAPTRQRQG